MDLSQFPLEVLEVLAEYLSARDLANMSAVSVRWREAFNLDLFWRQLCDPLAVSYLARSGTSVVEPHFSQPINVDTLEPICDWRIHVMRRAHLLRNWCRKRFLPQKLWFPTPVVNCTLGLDTSGNHWLVVNLGDRTEVWDVQTDPSLHAVIGNITGAPSHLEVVGNKLILVDFFLFVQVFHLKLPTLGFAQSSKFFYTDSEPVCVDLSDGEEVDSIRNRLRSCFRKGHVLFVMDHLLVGYCSYVENPKEYFLHLWNIQTESKFAQETVLSALHNKMKTYSCSIYISSDLQTKQLLCSLYLFDRYVSKLVLYSVKWRKFTNFSLTVSGKVDWCDISGDFVTTSHLLHQLHIYSTHSGNLVNILDTNAKMVFGPNSGLQYQMMGSYMIQPSRESVKVVNVQEHSDSLLLYFYSVYKVITIPPKFLAISARPYVSSNKMILEVWDIQDKIRIFDYLIAESDCPAYHMIHPLLTKTSVTLGKTVRLLSFW
ncbi:uncharacterized protein LOC124358915 [Homalodisca vitripennis]|uniref:uncharacterized protein LOC124358915 n=1 Tax=Homalodisca vitripennis TaxID=197043 RepID=UPI001EEB68A3|nr:uncharacterized protein LOC124358915 [Homalodisca vitripennis]KAG8261209.1 hypothetical protein J6590_078846 [Homalodisca vitripennis]KAG8270081.1 hypothetical protein J6590_092968 [Homalodisca vitripennis]